MDKKNSLEFKKAMETDAGFSQKFVDTAKAIYESDNSINQVDSMVKAAEQLGYELSYEEIERAFVASKQLDEEELKMVAGGDYVQTQFGTYVENCTLLWYCFNVIWDGSPKKTAACFSNYLCFSLECGH